MQSPVALQLRQSLALFGVPEDDHRVIPAACQQLAVERPGDCQDLTPAIFSYVTFTGNCSTPLPS